MSYCTARRLELMARIRHLEETVRELALEGASPLLLAEMQRRLQMAQEAMATHGDCGD